MKTITTIEAEKLKINLEDEVEMVGSFAARVLLMVVMHRIMIVVVKEVVMMLVVMGMAMHCNGEGDGKVE